MRQKLYILFKHQSSDKHSVSGLPMKRFSLTAATTYISTYTKKIKGHGAEKFGKQEIKVIINCRMKEPLFKYAELDI